MDLPLMNVMKRRSELDTARLEDDVVNALFSSTNKIALHGGTATNPATGARDSPRTLSRYLWDSDFKSLFFDSMEKAGGQNLISKYREKGVKFIHVKRGKHRDKGGAQERGEGGNSRPL